MPRKECYDQKHACLEREIDRLKRHLQMQSDEIAMLRRHKEELFQYVEKIRRDIRAVSKEMYLGEVERHGATPDELRTMRDVIDPYGLILSGVVR